MELVPERIGKLGCGLRYGKQPRGSFQEIAHHRRSSCQGNLLVPSCHSCSLLFFVVLSGYCSICLANPLFFHTSLTPSQPIQRVCKYPLLFAELLRFTPVYDCPQSHLEIEDALIRLREATGEINRATNDVKVKAVLEKTWILQDRLVFPHQVRPSLTSLPGRQCSG